MTHFQVSLTILLQHQYNYLSTENRQPNKVSKIPANINVNKIILYCVKSRSFNVSL